MHDGCEGSFGSGAQIVDKLRQMNFSKMAMPAPLEIVCACEAVFSMETMEGCCDSCGMVYGVTPCSAGDAANVQAAGIGY